MVNFLKFLIQNYGRQRSTRQDFLKMLPKQSIGAEIGVFKGEFSYQILKTTKPKELHLIDCWWERFGEYYPDWGDYTAFGKLSTRDAYMQVQKVVKDFKNKIEIHVGDDLQILKKFPDAYFDWVYLDSSHYYEHTKKELQILNTKIKSDGIIAGHDWQQDLNHEHHGVCKAVTEFCVQYSWQLVSLDKFTQWSIHRSL